MKRALFAIGFVLYGCGRSGYRDFTLPVFPESSPGKVEVDWRPQPAPVLARGPAGTWDSGDVLNPSVLREATGYLNLYSGYDGKTWRTGLAVSPDGLAWTKQGQILGPDPATEPDDYIAANGAAIRFRETLFYFYQSGRNPQIRLATQSAPNSWTRRGVVLESGPFESWDERGVADPYAFEAAGKLYLYYLGMDRARRQRLGVAVSENGFVWEKLRANPVLELGEHGAFDQNGLGEPAVWAARGSYWMLYTGRAHDERRALGIARSRDGVQWQKLDAVLRGDQGWDSQVVCDPTVLVEGNRVRVWYGGGDVPRPDENIHGQIGYAELSIRPK